MDKEKGTIFLHGAVLSVEGDQCVEVWRKVSGPLSGHHCLTTDALKQGSFEGPLSDPEAVGVALAQDLKKRGADVILQKIFALARPES